MKKGIFCISIDTELLWGRKDLPNSDYYKKLVKKEPQIIKEILGIFSKYNIHATWATVGKILEKNSSEWYGKNLVELIKKTNGQEIGGHTYSHKTFTQISKLRAQKELKAQRDIFKNHGFSITSFVFPQNKIKHLNLLSKYGIKQYRGKDIHENELLLPKIPPVFVPIKKDGCININGSIYFVSARGPRKYIPPGLRYHKCLWGINRAIKEKKIFHLWFHPMDFTVNPKPLLKELEMICSYAKNKSDKGLLDLKNMQEIGLLANSKD